MGAMKHLKTSKNKPNRDLVQSLRIELHKFLENRFKKQSTIVLILKLYDAQVNKKNILSIYTHTILEIFSHVIRRDIQSLETYTSSRSFN